MNESQMQSAVGSSALLDALEAVLLFHSGSHWDADKRAKWKRLTGKDDATTVVLCDTVRIALGRLPSCFGALKGATPDRLPPDLPLNDEQRMALDVLNASNEKLTDAGTQASK